MTQNTLDNNSDEALPAIKGCLITLERFRALREKTPSEDYIKRTGHHSSIGEHIRHCLEYMICLKQGLSDGHVDYDNRIRDKRLEEDSQLLYKTIKEISAWLTSLDSEDLKQALNIKEMSVTGVQPRPAQTSLERELVFQASHSVHHLAIMVLIAEIIGLNVPYEFGVAPSTLFYRASQQQPSS